MAIGDGISQYERNRAIGEFAAYIHNFVENSSERSDLTSIEKLQALLVVVENLVFTIRANADAK